MLRVCSSITDDTNTSTFNWSLYCVLNTLTVLGRDRRPNTPALQLALTLVYSLHRINGLLMSHCACIHCNESFCLSMIVTSQCARVCACCPNRRTEWFLPRVRTACSATAVLRPCLSVCPPSHSGVLLRRMKLRSCGFHYQVAKSF